MSFKDHRIPDIYIKITLIPSRSSLPQIINILKYLSQDRYCTFRFQYFMYVIII